MDSNHSLYFSSSSSSVSHVHSFMHLPPSVYPLHRQPSHELGLGEMALNSCLNKMQLETQHLRFFWHQQILEMDQIAEFKQHQLPLARIKRIMKSDEEVKMISADAPVLFAKACELFILELTLRSWLHTEETKRRTLQRVDIANAISRGEVYDFLLDIVPIEETKEEEVGGNFTQNEALRYDGRHFPLVPANCFNQNFHEIFYDGEEFATYSGARDVESLKEFVLDEAEKAARGQLDRTIDTL